MKRALIAILLISLSLTVLTSCSNSSITGQYSFGSYHLELTENGNFYITEDIGSVGGYVGGTKVVYKGQWERQGDDIYFYFDDDNTLQVATYSDDKIVGVQIGTTHPYISSEWIWTKVK